MSATTRVLRRLLDLPAARVRRVRVTRDVAVPMPDGVALRHDHYRPAGVRRGPVVLVRSPYGRRSFIGLLFGRVVAEHGFGVVVQSVRGTADSGGALSPFDEADDGVATVAWLAAQPFCDGRVATLGPSYLGIVQWALAPHAGPALRAMGTLVTASQFRDQTYPGGGFSLDNALAWTTLMRGLARGELAGRLTQLRLTRTVARVAGLLPLGDADTRATGASVDWYQSWLREGAPDSPYWAARSYDRGIAEVARRGVEVTMTGGWHDIFLPWQLADHAALRAAGAHPRLVIGPWVHASPAVAAAGLREALAGFDRTFDTARETGDDVAATTATLPVALTLTGGGGHRRLPDWPPAADERRWYLHGRGGLGADPPAAGVAGTTVVYDPADPTPAVGGPILVGASGPRDQTALEARDDVAVFTTPVLDADLVVVGPVTATVWVRSATAHLDVFVRVCDVDADGRSVNVTDGLLRLDGHAPEPGSASDVRRAEVALWPTGHRFAAGHRVRVQFSGGAHPRFARHPGTGESLADATTLVTLAREVLHDAEHPTHVTLPVETP